MRIRINVISTRKQYIKHITDYNLRHWYLICHLHMHARGPLVRTSEAATHYLASCKKLIERHLEVGSPTAADITTACNSREIASFKRHKEQ
jgi:hypothetical protein